MKAKKVIFIDRDGVINKDPGGWTEYSYITKWKDFHFLPGAKTAVRRLNRAGYDIVIISNQAGVSKGFYTKAALRHINKRMLEEIRKSGGTIRRAYYCVHQKSDNCGCRKPETGLFRQAERDLGVKAAEAYFIGDGQMDVEAGRKARMKTVLVLSGKSKVDDIEDWKARPDLIFRDLGQAVNFILKETYEKDTDSICHRRHRPQEGLYCGKESA